LSEREQQMKQDQTVRAGTAESSDPPAAERAEQAAGTNEAAPLVAGADVNPSRIDQTAAEEGETPAPGAEQREGDGASEKARQTVTPEKQADSSKQADAPKGGDESGSAAEGATAGEAAKNEAGVKAADSADADKEAKRKAAAEARAARAAAKAKADGDGGESAQPKPPSPNQPLLDRLVDILKREVGEDAVESAWINPIGDIPTVSLRAERLVDCARVLRDHPELQLNYLRNVAGVDMETHMEVVYHFISLNNKINYSIKVKTDREHPSVPSVSEVWSTANWNEREIYDLLGIDFPGHPDLRRILMPDDWVGYPLRKDYVPADPEV